MDSKPAELRRGWTTGACAAAAAKAACQGLLTGEFPDPVSITLPGGQQPDFVLAQSGISGVYAVAAIVKDAGDDPDVTHGALIRVRVSHGIKGAGVVFLAGPGVGTVTLPGLPVPPGEPAINPKPREMIVKALGEVSPDCLDYVVEVSVPGGEEIAMRTMNGRLGIIGGISILGTTGIVVPYSCAAWIASIHQGIDVARAAGLTHVAAATGDTSEKAVQRLYGLKDQQLIDMGDFVGGTLKYLRKHPIARVTIAGGVAKMTKLAQGMLDLHSKRGRADLVALADVAKSAGCDAGLAAGIIGSNTVAEAFAHASDEGIPLGDLIAARAWRSAAGVLGVTASGDRAIELEIIIFDREGVMQGRAPLAPVI